jgi:hypothetical protein
MVPSAFSLHLSVLPMLPLILCTARPPPSRYRIPAPSSLSLDLPVGLILVVHRLVSALPLNRPFPTTDTSSYGGTVSATLNVADLAFNSNKSRLEAMGTDLTLHLLRLLFPSYELRILIPTEYVARLRRWVGHIDHCWSFA